MFDWTDLASLIEDGAKVVDTIFNIRNADRQSDLDISAANARAIFSQESADLQAGFLRMQGDAALDVAEYNAGIYDKEADIALKLASRDKALIKDNADIQRSIDLRSYHHFLGSQVASVAGAGIELSGSAIYVMLDSAAQMDFTLATRKWAADEAVATRDVQGNLQNWEATVNAQRERYVGAVQKALKYKEADITQQLGALAAEQERA